MMSNSHVKAVANEFRSLIIISILFCALTTASAQTAAESKNRCVGGNPSAPIKIEVFSCYQCPPCRDFYLETMRPLLKEFAAANKVCVIYYEFPLEIHDYAREAARFGEAARHLGQDQWQRVSEALYLNLDQWEGDRKKIEPIVSSVLSPDEMTEVKKLIKDPEISKTIDHDLVEGHNRYIRGTPTFFIHFKGKEKRIVGKLSYPVLKDYLEGLLKVKK
jgi:protein-disulfide isomerase